MKQVVHMEFGMGFGPAPDGQTVVLMFTDTVDLDETGDNKFPIEQHVFPVNRDQLKEFVKNRLAPFKYPRWVTFLPDLPKTATGKIQRYQLRAMAAQKGAAEPGSDQSLSDGQ